jgi:hypothetical protein
MIEIVALEDTMLYEGIGKPRFPFLIVNENPFYMKKSDHTIIGYNRLPIYANILSHTDLPCCFFYINLKGLKSNPNFRV